MNEKRTFGTSVTRVLQQRMPCVDTYLVCIFSQHCDAKTIPKTISPIGSDCFGEKHGDPDIKPRKQEPLSNISVTLDQTIQNRRYIEVKRSLFLKKPPTWIQCDKREECIDYSLYFCFISHNFRVVYTLSSCNNPALLDTENGR